MNDPRTRFEAIISAPPYECDIERFPDDATKYSWPGSYKDRAVDLAWHVFEDGAKAVSQADQAAVAWRDPLLKLLDYADDSDGAQYGTLSTSLVRDLVNEAIASTPPEEMKRGSIMSREDAIAHIKRRGGEPTEQRIAAVIDAYSALFGDCDVTDFASSTQPAQEAALRQPMTVDQVKALADGIYRRLGFWELATELVNRALAASPSSPTPEPKDCPHAAPFRYCQKCPVSPCPIGLGAKNE